MMRFGETRAIDHVLVVLGSCGASADEPLCARWARPLITPTV